MSNFSAINGRADLTDVLLPDQVINDIIQETPFWSSDILTGSPTLTGAWSRV